MAWPRWTRRLCATLLGFDPADPPEKRRFDRAMLLYIESKAKAGASFAEIDLEFRMRIALAQVKRRVTDWLEKDPYTAHAAIEVSTAAVCRTLKKEEAEILLNTVAQLNVSDLAPPALAKRVSQIALDDANWVVRNCPVNPDFVAALRVR